MGIQVEWTGPVVETEEEPAKKDSPAKPAKKTTPKRKGRAKKKTTRKPKVWEPIIFEDTEGDKVTFEMTEDGYLRERLNNKITLERVTHLDINTAICRIIDDDGPGDCFTVREADRELLGKLRDMAARAMYLDLYWSTEEPVPEAWC